MSLELDDKCRLRGMLLGGAVGDEAGGRFEGLPPDKIPEEPLRYVDYHNPTWSDDTQLTLATCEALLKTRGKVLPEAIAGTLLEWFRKRELTGLGASTLKALRDLDAGGHWALCGRKGERAAGNGAATRVAPLAFFVDPTAPEGRHAIREVCRITHHHDEAYAAALAVAIAIHRGRHAELVVGPEGLARVAACLPDSVTRDRLRAMAAHYPGSVFEVASMYGASGWSADTVPLSLFAVSKLDATRSDSGRFADAISDLVRCGGDTDTIASIFGQVAGSYVGIAGMPIEALEMDPQGALDRLAAELAALLE